MKKQAKVRTRSAVKTSDAPQNTAQATTKTVSLLDTLLVQQPAPERQAALIHGVAVATLLELLPDGKVRIALPTHGIANLCATPVCALNTLADCEQVAVMFEQGDTSRALVLGPMAGAPAQAQAHEYAPTHEALIDNERIVIEAEQEIELRCGEAALILTRDGRILLRGSDITSLASGTQRIRGGRVYIN